jgi:hypothetical protein
MSREAVGSPATGRRLLGEDASEGDAAARAEGGEGAVRLEPVARAMQCSAKAVAVALATVQVRVV